MKLKYTLSLKKIITERSCHIGIKGKEHYLKHIEMRHSGVKYVIDLCCLVLCHITTIIIKLKKYTND